MPALLQEAGPGSGHGLSWCDPRILLGAYYGLRGIALIGLPILLGPNIDPPLIVVMILFGLDWVATVPPTAILCTRIYGREKGPIIFGWVFASHMIGAAAAATATGYIRDSAGDYATAVDQAAVTPSSLPSHHWPSP